MTETISEVQVQLSYMDKTTREVHDVTNTIEAVAAMRAMFAPEVNPTNVELEDAKYGYWLVELPVWAFEDLKDEGWLEASADGRVFDTDVTFKLEAGWL